MTDSEDEERLPTASEMRALARRLEESGDPFGALTVYDDLLRRYERGGEAIDDLGDAYRRAGDLRVELRQPSRAFAAYQQAAEHYARAGSAPEIKNLCASMINVVPAAGDVYVRCARRLCEFDHLDAALSVLTEYARKASDPETADAVSELRQAGLDKVSRLTALLDRLDEDTEGHATAAQSVSRELEDLPRSPDDLPKQKPAERSVPDRQVSPPAPPQRTAESRAARAGTRVWSSTASSKSPARNLLTGLSVRFYAWGAVLVVAILLVVILTRGFSSGALPSSSAMSTATSDSSVQAADAVAQDTLSSVQEPVAADPPAAPVEQTTPQSQPPSAPPQAQTPAEQAIDSAADTGAQISQPIVVGDLTVRTVSPAEFRGQQGFRVVHVLDSITEFIVESYPVDSTSASAYPLGTVIVNVVQPDTSVSIVRFDERHIVFASGVVPEDSMRVLMRLLRVSAVSQQP